MNQSNEPSAGAAPMRREPEPREPAEPTWPELLSTRYGTIGEAHAAWRERKGAAS